MGSIMESQNIMGWDYGSNIVYTNISRFFASSSRAAAEQVIPVCSTRT